MRLQLRRIELADTGRAVEFSSGLNIVAGPIATGKSTLMRMCRALLGGGIGPVSPEARDNVTALLGRLLVLDEEFSLHRPYVTTETAPVEIAGREEAWRLPAHRSDSRSAMTYGGWLLAKLGLPALRVPTAPTRPAESATSPITIGDYLLYCYLPDDTIDSSVFGHRQTFKDIKRKYIFQLAFGMYDPEIAALQERQGEIEARIRYLRAAESHFREFAQGTRLENRAQLQSQVVEVQEQLAMLETVSLDPDAPPDERVDGRADVMRDLIRNFDEQIADLVADAEREERSQRDMERLRDQLEVQSQRLSKAVVTGDLLVDYEFQRCPRCGEALSPDRSPDDHCLLCLQEPSQRPDRSSLLQEQDRIVAHIAETNQLIEAHAERALSINALLVRLRQQRTAAARELDYLASSYVSDAAERIRDRAASRTEALKNLEQLTEYLTLFERLDEAISEIAELEDERAQIDAAIGARAGLGEVAAGRITVLEEAFGSIVDRIGLPRFEGEPRAGVDGERFLPILNGRSFDQLSSGGLMLLTHVAFALAHQVAAIECGLALPNVLLIDNISKNVGTEDYDEQRMDSLFTVLADLSEQYKNDLQIIVATNTVPSRVEQYVRVHLSPDDLLIPTLP